MVAVVVVVKLIMIFMYIVGIGRETKIIQLYFPENFTAYLDEFVILFSFSN